VKQRAYAKDVERNQSAERQFLHSMTWRKIRLMKLQRDPLCERHLAQGQAVAAYLVHHVDENELNIDDNNLQSLCNNCHEEMHKAGRFRGKVHG
jgi:5-methylcytosine-specific restriction endonuclease McrA